jgi:hypothetical protein
MHNAEKQDTPVPPYDTGVRGGLWESSNTHARNKTLAQSTDTANAGREFMGRR